MSNNDSIDSINALIHLSNINRSIHKDRIQREFRFTIKIITFYLLCVSAKLTGNISTIGHIHSCRLHNHSFLGCPLLITIVIFLIVTLVISWWYLCTSAKSNAKNQRIAEIAENTIPKLLDGDKYKEFKKKYNCITKKNKKSHPSKHRWVLEALSITLFAILSLMIIIL